MSEAFIDTAFLIALANLRDSFHDVAIDLSRRLKGRKHVVTEAVLLEFGNALAKGNKVLAAAMIRETLSAKDVHIIYMNPKLLDAALSLYETHTDKEWSLVDCISFTVMRNRGITDALTADHHFAQAGFNPLMRT